MNNLVKILSSDDGEIRDKENQVWCLVETVCGDSATFCQGEYFGFGASGCEFEVKTVERGGITCPRCIERIKTIKSVRL